MRAYRCADQYAYAGFIKNFASELGHSNCVLLSVLVDVHVLIAIGDDWLRAVLPGAFVQKQDCAYQMQA